MAVAAAAAAAIEAAGVTAGVTPEMTLVTAASEMVADAAPPGMAAMMAPSKTNSSARAEER